MAEGFARRYGSDVMQVSSAGIAPAPIIQPLTKQVMEAKKINIDDQQPKDFSLMDLQNLDLIVNMSGAKLPASLPCEVRTWKVEDPIGCSEEVYVTVRDRIEMQVMHLILELRRNAKSAAPPPAIRGAFRTPRSS